MALKNFVQCKFRHVGSLCLLRAYEQIQSLRIRNGTPIAAKKTLLAGS